MNFSREKILALAPDPLSAERSVECAVAFRWQLLKGTERVVWGEYKTPAEPFYTAVDVQGPGFKCTCPSRRFPCKHALGLLLLLFQNPEAFKVSHHLPEAVQKWIAGRDKRNVANREPSPQPAENQNFSTVKIDDKRRAEMEAGFEELQVWIEDVFRQGLAIFANDGEQKLETIAARLVDAKLGSVGRRFRLAKLLLKQPEWHEKLLALFGETWLLAKAFRQMENLPPPFAAEILQQAGVSLKKEEILKNTGLFDRWQVLGEVTGWEENLQFRRVWLYGQKTEKMALVLDFAFGNQEFETPWKPGTCVEGELVFYPSSLPLRAVVKSLDAASNDAVVPTGFANFSEFFGCYAQALGAHPWLNIFPAVLHNVIPVFSQNGDWHFVDNDLKILPFKPQNLDGWRLMAVSGGHPMQVFGEWENNIFSILNFWADPENPASVR